MSGRQANGWFGPFGGRFAPETLIPALREVEREYARSRKDPAFRRDLSRFLKDFAGRPTPIHFAARLSTEMGRGVRIFLKWEDLCHTGAHKINNVLGQVLLATRMRKTRIVAETGAGQHGVATATGAALFGLKCVIYMGEEDVRRQRLNVFRMRQLGASVVCVKSGTRTLKDAINEAFRDWVTNVRNTHYVFGSTAGPHPYPTMVRDFQSVIGREARRQMLKREGRLPTHVIACVNGGSNAIGIFSGFLADRKVKLVGVEAAGEGLDSTRHAATLAKGRPGILHGSMSLLLQDRYGQVSPTHSIAPGLDYPGVGPEHSYLKMTRRARYESATDEDALRGFSWLARMEGILPALEPAHAIGFVKRHRRRFAPGSRILLNLSGRGDKDVEAVAEKTDGGG